MRARCAAGANGRALRFQKKKKKRCKRAAERMWTLIQACFFATIPNFLLSVTLPSLPHPSSSSSSMPGKNASLLAPPSPIPLFEVPSPSPPRPVILPFLHPPCLICGPRSCPPPCSCSRGSHRHLHCPPPVLLRPAPRPHTCHLRGRTAKPRGAFIRPVALGPPSLSSPRPRLPCH